MNIDIFCHVIDYWGDVAVSWRCAKALKRVRSNWNIRYFCDDWSRWNDLLVGAGKVRSYREIENYYGIVLQNFIEGNTEIGDVTIACLSCDLPLGYRPKGCVVNLEYLSMDRAAVSINKQQSFPKKTYFFTPGIFKDTEGLIFGDFFEKKEFLCNDLFRERVNFCKRKELNIDVNKTWISCYLYNCDWDKAELPNDIALIGPLQINKNNVPENYFSCVLNLEEYDELLWLCDQHYVRGEDSLSRAILTGNPFLWQAYTENDDDHIEKVVTLLEEIFGQKLYSDEVIMRVFRDINEKKFISWTQWDYLQKKYKQSFQDFTQRVLSLGSQEENLANFIQSLVSDSSL